MKKSEFFLEYNLPQNICFFDIETTGLSVEKDSIIAISYAKYFNINKCKIVQIQSIDIKNDEKLLILDFLEALLGMYELYTFNGDEFEYNFLKKKLKYYDINFDFNFKLTSLKSNLRHFSSFIGLEKFSREYIENFFGISKKQYYDMHKIIKNIKKENEISDEIIAHNKEEISTLLYIYERFTYQKQVHKVNINFIFYYLDDIEIYEEKLKLSFKSSQKNKFTQIYKVDGNTVTKIQNDVILEIFVKHLQTDDGHIILYETKNEYRPLVINCDIIYQNIYLLLTET